MTAELIQLSEVAGIAKGPIRPDEFPDEVFSLHSIPAYDEGEPTLTEGKEIRSSKTLIQKGDVLVSKLNPRIPRVWHIAEQSQKRMVCSTEFIPFRVKDPARLDPEYLGLMMRAPQFMGELAAMVRSSTRSHQRVRPDDIAIRDIPLPDLAEQRRIVARIKECMERVDEIAGLRSQALAEREFLLESQIEAMLAGVEGAPASLAAVSQINSKLVDPRETQYQKMIHVGGANIASRTGVLVDLKTSQEEGLKSGKFVFDETMVLYNKIRPYLVKVARPDFQGLCSADMYPLSPDPCRLTRDYLFYLLMSRDFTHYAIAGSNRAGIPKVNREHLFAYRFKLPTLVRQAQITDLLDEARSAVEELRTEMTTGHDEITALRESILRKAFAAEF